jgi:ketosteroid isomerase-like protein
VTTTAKDVALAYVASFASGDPDEICALVAAGFVSEHTSALGHGCVGKDAYRSHLPAFLEQFPGLRYEVEDALAEGDQVAVFYVMSAEGVELRGAFHLWVEDGLVARRIDYWDSLTYLRQTEAT